MTKTSLKQNFIRLSSVALALGVLSIGLAAQAYQGNPGTPDPDCSPERKEAMEKAFSDNDYSAWKNLMSGKGRVIQVINEDNFDQFARAHELALAGDIEEAKKIRSELGLGMNQHQGNGARSGQQYLHRNTNN